MSVTPESLEAAGWKRIEAEGFTGHVGPFWMLDEENSRTLGLFVEPKHCNVHLGTLHGGVAMTFADIGLGSGVAKVLGEQRLNCVTASLNTQFISIARIGEFIQVTPEIIRQSKALVFVRGLIKVDDKIIASAEGIWKVLEPRS